METLEFGSGSTFGGKPVSVSLMSNNIDELKGAKEMLKEKFRQNPLLKDIADNDPAGIKEIEITLKESAYALGLTLNDVIGQVRSGFFGFRHSVSSADATRSGYGSVMTGMPGLRSRIWMI